MPTPTSPDPHPPLVLATDLDGTFAGGEARERARLQRFLAEHPEATLIYVTGRSVDAARALMGEAPLPHPDVLIADVGTTVVAGDPFRPVTEIHEEIEAVWPGGEAVRTRMRGVEGVEEQALRVPRRVSYWVREGAVDAAIARAAEALEGLAVDLVGSAGVYLDVLPRGVNKGTTLRRLLRHRALREADVVVAGDTLNDLALFDTGLRGIAVGNCEPGLRARVCERPHVYVAEEEGAAGILEGLRFFGWEVDRGE